MAPRRWAGAKDEISGPAGCCRQVASHAARGRRPRRGPRGAFPANRPPRAGPGLLGPGPRPRERPAAPRPPPPPSARLQPPYLRLQPARPQEASTPSGPARRGPTQASRPASQSDGYETGSLRPFRSRSQRHRVPLLAAAARPAATAAAITNGSAGLRGTRPPSATDSAASQSQAAWPREAGTWRRRSPLRGGAGEAGATDWGSPAYSAGRHPSGRRPAAGKVL